jgi:chemotaxis protein CheX
MHNERSRIYLVASKELQWAQDFRAFMSGRYEIIMLKPEDLETRRLSSDSPVQGVVVLYESDCPPAEWFKRVRSCVLYMDLPLIAVTTKVTPAMRAQLLAAGASAVCDADDGPKRALIEAENRCNIEPVIESIRQQLLNPFIDATVRTLTMLTGGVPQLHSVYCKNGYNIFGDYSALMTLRTHSEGTLVISFPQQTSYEIGKRMILPLGVEINEELVQSCLGEIANIIVGQAKGALASTAYRFTMSLPNVIAGRNHVIRYQSGLPCLVASFTGEIGDFALQLCMDFNGQESKGDIS